MNSVNLKDKIKVKKERLVIYAVYNNGEQKLVYDSAEKFKPKPKYKWNLK